MVRDATHVQFGQRIRPADSVRLLDASNRWSSDRSSTDWPELRHPVWRLAARLDGWFGFTRLFDGSFDAVLLYHSVGGIPGTDYDWDISEQVFREQLRVLDDRYEIVDLEALVSDPAPGRKRVAITFDDGFRNVATVAAPILREFDAPATLFACPEFLDAASSTQLRARHGLTDITKETYLTRDQIRRLADDDLFTIGNHTASHVDLTTLSDEAAVEREILMGKERLEDLTDEPVDRFSYPYGAVDDRAASIVERSHTLAATSKPSLVGSGPDRLAVPRLDACQPLAVLSFEVTDTSHRIRRLARKIGK